MSEATPGLFEPIPRALFGPLGDPKHGFPRLGYGRGKVREGIPIRRIWALVPPIVPPIVGLVQNISGVQPAYALS